MENSLKNSELFNNNFDLYNFEPNSLIAMSFNFDILKYVITELINSQRNTNDEILQLKNELLEHKKHYKEIESSIIEMKLSSNILSPDIKQKLEEDKNNIDIKVSEIDQEINYMKTKEKENSRIINTKSNKSNLETEKEENEIKDSTQKEEKTLENNQNNQKEKIPTESENINLNENKEKIPGEENIYKQIENKENNDIKVKENILKDEDNKEKIEFIQKNEAKIDEIFKKFETIISEIKNVKSKQLYLEKDFIEFKNSINDNLSQKIENTLPIIEKNINSKVEYAKKLLNENITNNSNNINDLRKEFNKTSSEINKNIVELNSKENKNSIDLAEIKTSNTSLSTKINTLADALPLFTKLSDFRQYKNDIVEKINGDKKELSINLALIQKSLNILKGQFFDYINDQTDNNNLENLLKKFENLQNSVYKLQDFEKDMEEKEKRRVIINPNKYVKIEAFNEFVASIHKNFDSNKKEVNEMRINLDDFKNKESGAKATLKDLKFLEDSVLGKMESLKQLISEKFVDKNTLNKNTKILEMQTKQLIEDNKKSEKIESWILAKRQVGGHLCASCEAYLGDLSQISNTKFIPWNKYPQKESSEKVFKISGGISKIFQMVKNKNNNLSNSTNNSYNNGNNTNMDRYITSDRNEDNGRKSPKTRNNNKNININILSNRNNNIKKYIKNDLEEEGSNLPRISMTMRKNNSSMNLFSSDKINKGINTINNMKQNLNSHNHSNSHKNNIQNFDREYSYLNNERKIKLLDDDNNNAKSPKITKIFKKH